MAKSKSLGRNKRMFTGLGLLIATLITTTILTGFLVGVGYDEMKKTAEIIHVGAIASMNVPEAEIQAIKDEVADQTRRGGLTLAAIGLANIVVVSLFGVLMVRRVSRALRRLE